MALENIVTKVVLIHSVAIVTLSYIVATMALNLIIGTMNSDITVAFDNIIAFVIPLVALLTS
jgi:hypothetical protein